MFIIPGLNFLKILAFKDNKVNKLESSGLQLEYPQ